MSDLITCVRAKSILDEQAFDWGKETVDLVQAAGRVLAEPLVADRDQPPFNRVAMDGIAFDYAAYAAGRRTFARARVQGAGEAPSPLPGPSHCVEIMTGAALPEGCTTVVRYEDLEPTADGFTVPEGIEDAVNIHPRGKDTKAGATLAAAGTRIGVATIGMLATFGYARVSVKRRPRVAIVATGDELVRVDEQPAAHQIRRSNLYQLAALLDRNGYPSATYHLRDDPATLKTALTKLIQSTDVIILSGGVSKGKFDFVPATLVAAGAEKLFHGVAQRPGKPLWAGRTSQTIIFGLPGNPQSSLSCCLTYVLPFLDRNLGRTRLPEFAELTVDVPFRPPLSLFSYVEVVTDSRSGKRMATPVRHAGSGDASSLLRGNAFLELPAGKELYPAGGVYEVRYL